MNLYLPCKSGKPGKRCGVNEKELILTDLLGCRRHELYLKKISLSKKQSKVLERIRFLRARGKPLQYILGKAYFMGLRFNLVEGTFIPRPETEILVETAIEAIKNKAKSKGSIKILDIGTGSGCIAVSLAKLLPLAEITAVDISKVSIDTARENAKLNNVANRIRFIKSDLFPDIAPEDISSSEARQKYDIIVSNPPYIPRGDLDSLQSEVKYEPKIALDGGEDGLEFYRRIIDKSRLFLKRGALLIMETGLGQSSSVKDIVSRDKNFKFVKVVYDYNKIDRVILSAFA